MRCDTGFKVHTDSLVDESPKALLLRLQLKRISEMDATDTELVDRLRSGDREAFAQLTTRWQGKMYALAYRLTQDVEDAHDITQTAVMQMYRGVAHFNGRASFSTWAHRVVVNLCRDHQRTRQRQNETRLEVQVSGRPEESLLGGGPNCEARARVARAVASLPVAMREAVIMKYYQGLTFLEIAEVVEAPVPTIKSRVARGLQLLRELLEDRS